MVSNRGFGLETKLILKSGEIVDGVVFDKKSLELFRKAPQQYTQYLGMPNDNFPIAEEIEETANETKSEYEKRCERVEEEKRMAELEEQNNGSDDLLAYLLLFNDDYDY